MSVRAHRVIAIDIKLEQDYESFNLWQDRELVDFLDAEDDIFSKLSDDGTGIIEVPVETLEKAVGQAGSLGIGEDTVECLKKDIAWAKSKDEESILYYCF